MSSKKKEKKKYMLVTFEMKDGKQTKGHVIPVSLLNEIVDDFGERNPIDKIEPVDVYYFTPITGMCQMDMPAMEVKAAKLKLSFPVDQVDSLISLMFTLKDHTLEGGKKYRKLQGKCSCLVLPPADMARMYGAVLDARHKAKEILTEFNS